MSNKDLIQTRYEAVLLQDATDSAPNNETDGRPREDDAGHGLLSPMSVKSRLRHFLYQVKGEPILYREGNIKNDLLDAVVRNAKGSGDPRTLLCKAYLDVRLFGSVLTGAAMKNQGSIHGPVQFSWGRSIDPIYTQQHGLTCSAPPKKTDKGADTGRMGSVMTVPYALYRSNIFVSPSHVCRPQKKNGKRTAPTCGFRGTGMTEGDLEKMWEGLLYMHEHTRSAGRNQMATRKLYVFEHDNMLGRGRADRLLNMIQVRKKDDVQHPSGFDDYEVEVVGRLPKGVQCYEWLIDDDGGVVWEEVDVRK